MRCRLSCLAWLPVRRWEGCINGAKLDTALGFCCAARVGVLWALGEHGSRGKSVEECDPAFAGGQRIPLVCHVTGIKILSRWSVVMGPGWDPRPNGVVDLGGNLVRRGGLSDLG